jgi:hypothetical protein
LLFWTFSNERKGAGIYLCVWHWGWSQGLVHARQALCHRSTSSALEPSIYLNVFIQTASVGRRITGEEMAVFIKSSPANKLRWMVNGPLCNSQWTSVPGHLLSTTSCTRHRGENN